MSKITLSQVLFFLSFSVFLMTGCNQASSSESNPAPSTNAPAVTQTPPVNAVVELKCIDKGSDDMDNPVNEVVLSVNGKETSIARINGCQKIETGEYKDKQIPADAVSACGGWWAGRGDYFYVIVKDGSAIVFAGWQEEEQTENSFHWTETKKVAL